MSLTVLVLGIRSEAAALKSISDRAQNPPYTPGLVGFRNRDSTTVITRSDRDVPPRRTSVKGHSLPLRLPKAGDRHLGFVAVARSNCPAGRKPQAATASGPRPGRQVH